MSTSRSPILYSQYFQPLRSGLKRTPSIDERENQLRRAIHNVQDAESDLDTYKSQHKSNPPTPEDSDITRKIARLNMHPILKDKVESAKAALASLSQDWKIRNSSALSVLEKVDQMTPGEKSEAYQNAKSKKRSYRNINSNQKSFPFEEARIEQWDRVQKATKPKLRSRASSSTVSFSSILNLNNKDPKPDLRISSPELTSATQDLFSDREMSARSSPVQSPLKKKKSFLGGLYKSTS